MIVKQLQLNNVRVFQQAEFNFQPGMNLLVGVNGVGKSTVLDVLRILFSQLMPKISGSTDKPIKFTNSDISVTSINKEFLETNIVCKIGQTELEYPGNYYKKSYVAYTQKERQKKALANNGSIGFDSIETFETEIQKQTLLAIFFSPHRSILNSTKLQLKDDISPAHAEALEARQLKLKDFVDWWQARKKLAEEGLGSGQTILNALEQAVTEFLGCSNLHVDEKKKTLLIEKSGVTLDVKQLSDGERGILALVLDLTKRLAEANPYLENPAKGGKAVVLIDELDLHLHPKWQRTIVDQLTRTFPNCQFIATTHSPQIISEVQADSITFLIPEGNQVVVRPARQAYGLDTNWILDHLMDVHSRPKPAQKLIDQIEDFLQEGELDKAHEYVQKLREMLHGDDTEVVRLETSIYNLEALADEMDSEE
ncbi:MAG: AAA family ATPase [Acidobacteria bacterium]|nr:AAA family ATPase [Acidobacteriota bacterium]